MSKIVRSLFAIAIVLTASACGEGDTDQAFTEEITHEQVRQYLLEHPELVLDDPKSGTRSVEPVRSASRSAPLPGADPFSKNEPIS